MASGMKKNLFQFFILSLFIFPVSPFLHAQSLSWKTIGTGLFYVEAKQEFKEQQTITFSVLKIDLEYNMIKPILSLDTKTVRQMLKETKAFAVINANFFDADHKPLGLILRDKETLQKKKNISWWSVFCIQKKRASILHTQSYFSGGCEQAIQAGPRLVVNGSLPKLKPQVARASAVGINAKGDVFFVISNQPISIEKLADFFRRPENEGGLGAHSVLNLDGGSSSQMSIQTEKFNLTIPSLVSVPVGLGVFTL